ncbi:MAG: hypothetical protein CMD14_03260 [Flavobacteriales bacterium]|nr:hypothetical protein [Flavobacteriales bacterium]
MDLPFIYKYQPLYLQDFEMDDKLLELIRILIKMDNLNILFVGDSGSGKSSLISAVLREYYDEIDSNDNIMYINTLKEQGISYYRNDVKIFCQTACNILGKKKILVLDDLDIINEQSQQVFRNFIDKYSHNVHFIASCSNTNKIIESIQSRINSIKIKALRDYNLSKIMKRICKIENISITNESEEFIISISSNSVRTMVNYLEKFKLLDCDIDINTAIKVCTNISFKDFETYTDLCKNKKDYINSIKILYNLIEKGYSVMDILDNYFMFVKVTKQLNDDEKYKVFQFICKYITIFYDIHEDEIELALFTNNLISIFN